MSTYIESFARAWAKQRLDKLHVLVDRDTGAVLFTFFGRHEQVTLKDALLQEDALRRCAEAIDNLLGIPANRRAEDENGVPREA